MYDFLSVCHCNYSSILYRLRVIDVEYYRGLDMWVKGHSRSLKLVQLQSLSAVSYLPSIVTMAVSVAVCGIFSVSKSGVTLKTLLGFVESHWKRHHSTDRIRVSIHLP